MTSIRKITWAQRLGSYLNEKVIEQKDTPVNPQLEVSLVNGRMVLNSLNVNYSFGGLHKVFQQVFKRIRLDRINPEQALIVGFGAGSVASIIRNEYHLNTKITGVEADEDVIRIARDYFDLDDFNDLDIEIAKADEFMASNDRSYDMIVVDVFVDYDIPKSCQTVSFLKQLRARLNDGGILIFNALVHDEKSRIAVERLHKLIEKEFNKVDVIYLKNKLLNQVFIANN